MNINDAIKLYGSDAGYKPTALNFEPTDAPAGSDQKVMVLAERVQAGNPLWHPDDRQDLEGITGSQHNGAKLGGLRA